MIPVIDFETEAIESRPVYPPKPVGVSIMCDAFPAGTYMSWGHPSGNNCSQEDARESLAYLWGQPMLFHNGRFDTEVARVWMGLPYPEDPTYIEDTLFLNYLYDPNADSLSLKPSATRILGIEPTEQQKLQGYLASIGYNGKEWGAHISKAPAEIVGPYAIGDVYRTHRLYEHLIRIIEQRGMLDAYRREQRLAPILSANEADGIRVDLDNLERDHVIAEKALIEVGKRLKALIGVDDPTPSGLVSALVASGRVRQEDFLLTPTGQLSTAKESLDIAVKDEELRQVLQYRANLKTILSTFMRPWLEKGTANKGRLHPEWNQVRGEVYGTRTGRLSSSNPNFQNIPTEFKVAAPAGLPPLPFMRRYILPDEGQIIVTSDFNGQEMRIASHFAEGRAAEIYRNDPGADFHAVVAGILKEEAGIALPHKDVKITGFSLLYGSGTRALAQLLGVDTETAKRIKKHYFDALPGFKELMDEVSARGRSGLPVKTWGGRLLHAETAMINGRLVNFAYKLTNYLVQGSAADQTKEAVITAGYKKRDKRFLATVHDENVYSVDPDYLASNVLDIKQSMELQEGWDVPFKAKVKVGPNWWDIEDYNG